MGQDAILEPDPMSVHMVTDLFGCHSLTLYPVSIGNNFTLILIPDHAGGNHYAAACWARLAGALDRAKRFSHGRRVVCCIVHRFSFRL